MSSETSLLKLRTQREVGFLISEKDFRLGLYISMGALSMHIASFEFFKTLFEMIEIQDENRAFSFELKLCIRRTFELDMHCK